MIQTRQIKAPVGCQLTAKNWLTEAALRMLMNNLDPQVAEDPQRLIVYGGRGKAARNWLCFDEIQKALIRLEADETLLIQSGKPVGIFRTHTDAPRVLIANSNLVARWATWEHFNELDRVGLMMYGQMTAGSWIYIGSQGIIQGTYETLCAAINQKFNGNPNGKWLLTSGLGGMGGAQPLAATMAGLCCLVVECDEKRIQRRIASGFLDKSCTSLQEALMQLHQALANGETISIGLRGNAAEIFPRIEKSKYLPDLVTDQTSAHDPLHGYLPIHWDIKKLEELRNTDPTRVIEEAKHSMAVCVEAMVKMQDKGACVFDYGNNLRQMALDAGYTRAFDYPGFVPKFIRPLFCQGIGPFRWVALSGDPQDIKRTDEKVMEIVTDQPHLHRWLKLAQEKIKFQGLPARICWLGLRDRARVALAFNQMVSSGELKAPIVIGRDHLDSGSVASPNRETENMRDGSDSVSDWPLLNALLNTASGGTWVSIHHGGGVGIGYSQHAGVVIVADGTEAAAKRLQNTLWNDPATGVMRHADAGYKLALDCAQDFKLDLPMCKTPDA